jgi:hypothetical protein
MPLSQLVGYGHQIDRFLLREQLLHDGEDVLMLGVVEVGPAQDVDHSWQGIFVE